MDVLDNLSSLSATCNGAGTDSRRAHAAMRLRRVEGGQAGMCGPNGER